jgi:molybdopterin converting factor small subunit
VPVTFHIPSSLSEFTGGKTILEIPSSPATVAEALKELCTRYPGIRDRIVTEQWEIRQHVNIFVGDENIRFTGGPVTGIRDGANISIVPAISGGKYQRAPI